MPNQSEMESLCQTLITETKSAALSSPMKRAESRRLTLEQTFLTKVRPYAELHPGTWDWPSKEDIYEAFRLVREGQLGSPQEFFDAPRTIYGSFVAVGSSEPLAIMLSKKDFINSRAWKAFVKASSGPCPLVVFRIKGLKEPFVMTTAVASYPAVGHPRFQVPVNENADFNQVSVMPLWLWIHEYVTKEAPLKEALEKQEEEDDSDQ